MNYYSPEQVKAAVEAGVITPQDAEYMLQEQRAGAAGGVGSTLYTDRDAALRMLVDPTTPEHLKKDLLKSLQQYDELNPPSEMKYGAGFPWGATLGGAAGALGAGLVSGKIPRRKIAMGLGPGPTKDKLAKFLVGPDGGLTVGALGALLGGGVGATAGSYIAPARRSPYEDPLGA